MLRLLQRICWNTRGWQFPSGSTDEGGFPGEKGFGHEEWNFQLSDTWNGFVFPYTYSVPQQKKVDHNNGKFDIGFFTCHQKSKEWLFVGIHHNSQFIAEEEYPKIIKHFKSNGTFKRRAKELSAVTSSSRLGRTALQEVTRAFSRKHISVKTSVDDVEYFPQPIRIEKPGNHRFVSFTYVEDFSDLLHGKKDVSRQQSSALAEDGYTRESPDNLSIIIPKHNILSNRFCAWLQKKGIEASQEQNYVDILFNIGETTYIAELKIVYGVGPTKAIREALGQLFEYNHYPGRDKNDEWVIILDQKPIKKDIQYIETLKDEFDLPLTIGWLEGEEFLFYPEFSL